MTLLKKLYITFLALIFLIAAPAMAAAPYIESDKILTAQQAYDMKQADPKNVTFLDVRSRAEIHYTGIADNVDANIPYRFDTTEWKMKKGKPFGYYKTVKNQDFAAAVQNLIEKRGLNMDSPIIIMCKAGTRAPYTARALTQAGFNNVYIQSEGFEGPKAKDGPDKGKRVVSGWKIAGLPWSYDLLPEKMYFNFKPE